MADENNKKDDRNNDKDPYNFFKLGGEPNDDGGPSGGKGPKFPFFGLMIAVVCVLMFVNLFLMRKPEEQIDFSTFEQLVEDGKIVKVEINLNSNIFIGYGPQTMPDFVSSSSSEKQVKNPFSLMRRSYPAQEVSNRQVYRTTGVLLDSFLKTLEEKNIHRSPGAGQRGKIRG